MLSRALPAALVLGLAGPAAADPLLPRGQDSRIIPFALRDGRPVLPVQVGGVEGVMMLDNGTPFPVFLNRDALALEPGTPGPQGKAASGQTITLMDHPAPTVRVAGQVLTLPDRLRSGDFGFVQAGLGADFLGFIGTPALAPHAFVLDYDRQTLTLLAVDATGALTVPAPQPADIRATVRFALWPGEQPLLAASIGAVPILTDIDTGDSGTLYLSTATRAMLQSQGHLRSEGGRHWLSGLAFGGAQFGETPVDLVMSGSAADQRAFGQPDFLRLGSAFLARHPTLWNFPAGEITVLARDATYLLPR